MRLSYFSLVLYIEFRQKLWQLPLKRRLPLYQLESNQASLNQTFMFSKKYCNCYNQQ